MEFTWRTEDLISHLKSFYCKKYIRHFQWTSSSWIQFLKCQMNDIYEFEVHQLWPSAMESKGYRIRSTLHSSDIPRKPNESSSDEWGVGTTSTNRATPSVSGPRVKNDSVNSVPALISKQYKNKQGQLCAQLKVNSIHLPGTMEHVIQQSICR